MDEKRSQILTAAKDLFNRLGYNKTSVDDISQSVGMKKSSLYYYFKNKEDMFMCSFKDEWENQFRVFADEANKMEDPGDKIMSYIIQSLNYYEMVVLQHNIPVKVLIETRNLYRQFMDNINEERVGFYESCIQLGVESGQFKPCDTRKVAESIFNVKFSMQYDAFNMFINTYPTKENFQTIKDDVVFAIKLILDGLRK